MKTKEQEFKDEIEKKFYKIKDNDSLTLTGKQLRDFAEYNRKEAKQEFIEDEIKILEEVALDLFGKQQVRWRHTKLTKQFNDILERNSKKLMDRAEELKKSLGGKNDDI